MAIREVPFYRIKLTKAEIDKVVETLKSGWLTTGQVTHQFEDEFAACVGAKYAVAVSSCTAALHLSLLTAGVGSGDEVITTPYTFVATAETIIHAGATPVFVDTERDSFNIDLDLIPGAITEKTKAVSPVHIAGLPCDLVRLEALRRKHKLAIIHDAAHALGAAWGRTKVGATPDFNCFSFYATKNLTTGEGGMVTTDSRKYRDKSRILSLHGISKDAWRRYSDKKSWKYRIVELGYKYNLSDISSSLGLMQLRRFDQMQAERRRLAALYHHHLSDIDELQLPHEPEGVTHAWHLYIVKLRYGGDRIRNEVIARLKSLGIGTSVHFIPLHLHPYYRRRWKYARHDFPNSYNHYKSVISLPFYVGLGEADVRYIGAAFRKVFLKGKGTGR